MKTLTALPQDDAPLLEALVTRLGADAVHQDASQLTFFSTDLAAGGPTILAVIAPPDEAALADAVRLCTEAGCPVIPRGGGFSYTGGYVPVAAHSVMVDTRRLKQIDIHAEDMYVIAGAGVTWAELYEALKAQGLRTPYFGPMSGFGATVGGALSQGSFFLGSTQYGQAADSVLGLEVALADGTLLRTGSWGSAHATPPFLRNYGPDLTGLFLSDTGAFGFKTRAALRLIPFPAAQAFASFAFEDELAALAALSAIGRTGLAGECYLWDPYFVRIMAQASAGLLDDLKFLSGVARGGGSLVRGLKNAARMAAAGRSSFSGDVFVLNITIDDYSAVGADARLEGLRAIAVDLGGQPITASAPMAMRGTPFTDFNTAERRRPQRSVPIHGLSCHSEAAVVSRRIRAVIDERKADLAELGVHCGVIYFAVGQQTVACEPIPYWDDPEFYAHDRVEERSDLVALAGFSDRPPATKAAFAVRAAFKAVFREAGCAHVQIGKSYPWLETRAPATLRLAQQVKALLDPHNLVNPGSLGFGA